MESPTLNYLNGRGGRYERPTVVHRARMSANGARPVPGRLHIAHRTATVGKLPPNLAVEFNRTFLKENPGRQVERNGRCTRTPGRRPWREIRAHGCAQDQKARVPRSLGNIARINPNVRQRPRSLPDRRLRTVGVEEDVPLHLPRARTRADDVARVTAADLPGTLSQHAVRTAADRRLVQVGRHALLEHQDLIVRHLRAELRASTRHDVEWLCQARARGSGRY